MLRLLTDPRYVAAMFPTPRDAAAACLLFTPVVWWVVLTRGFMRWGRP